MAILNDNTSVVLVDSLSGKVEHWRVLNGSRTSGYPVDGGYH